MAEPKKTKMLPPTDPPQPEPGFMSAPEARRLENITAPSYRGQFSRSNAWQTAKMFGVSIAGYVMFAIKESDPETLQRMLESLGSPLGWPAAPAVVMDLFELFRKDK